MVSKNQIEIIRKFYGIVNTKDICKKTRLSKVVVEQIHYKIVCEDNFNKQLNKLTDEQKALLIPYLTHPKYRNNFNK